MTTPVSPQQGNSSTPTQTAPVTTTTSANGTNPSSPEANAAALAGLLSGLTTATSDSATSSPEEEGSTSDLPQSGQVSGKDQNQEGDQGGGEGEEEAKDRATTLSEEVPAQGKGAPDILFTQKSLSTEGPLNTSGLSNVAGQIEQRSEKQIGAMTTQAASITSSLPPLNTTAVAASFASDAEEIRTQGAAIGLSTETVASASRCFDTASHLSASLDPTNPDSGTISQIQNEIVTGYTTIALDLAGNPTAMQNFFASYSTLSPQSSQNMAKFAGMALTQPPPSPDSKTGSSSDSASNPLYDTPSITAMANAVAAFAGNANQGMVDILEYQSLSATLNADIGNYSVQASNATTQNTLNQIQKIEHEQEEAKRDAKKNRGLGQLLGGLEIAGAVMMVAVCVVFCPEAAPAAAICAVMVISQASTQMAGKPSLTDAAAGACANAFGGSKQAWETGLGAAECVAICCMCPFEGATFSMSEGLSMEAMMTVTMMSTALTSTNLSTNLFEYMGMSEQDAQYANMALAALPLLLCLPAGINSIMNLASAGAKAAATAASEFSSSLLSSAGRTAATTGKDVEEANQIEMAEINANSQVNAESLQTETANNNSLTNDTANNNAPVTNDTANNNVPGGAVQSNSTSGTASDATGLQGADAEGETEGAEPEEEAVTGEEGEESVQNEPYFSQTTRAGVLALNTMSGIMQSTVSIMQGALEVQMAQLGIELAQLNANLSYSKANTELIQNTMQTTNTSYTSNTQAMNQNVSGIGQQNANMAQNAAQGIGATEFRA